MNAFRIIAFSFWICCTAFSQQYPFARLSDHTVELEPSKMSLLIPNDWLDRYSVERINNIHFTRDQLASVKEAPGTQWDGDYARIVNSVLPFENCALHTGGEEWGLEGISHADVQLRVYIGKWSLKSVKLRIKRDGFRMAQTIAKETDEKIDLLPVRPSIPAKARIESNTVNTWHQFRIALPLWYNDYGGEGNVEFHVKSFGKDSVVLVFMYASGASKAKFINPIISSFTHP